MPRYHVHRSIHIDAAPRRVFDTVADFGTWTTWSPWLCAEPTAQVDVTDDASSVGSVYSWKGELVGQGEIEHRHLDPGRLIEDEIRFVKPFRSQSKVSFELAPDADGTTITWHMRGSLPWFLFWMTSQMEVFIGMDYERGLKMLKEWIETGQILSQTTIRGVESIEPMEMAGVRRRGSIREIAPAMDAAFDDARQKLSQHGLPCSGTALSVYHKFDLKAQSMDYTSGYPIPPDTAALPNGLSRCSIPASKALVVEHQGSYDNLGNAWSAAHQFIRYKKLKGSKSACLERYLNDPRDTPPESRRTEILIPLK